MPDATSKKMPDITDLQNLFGLSARPGPARDGADGGEEGESPGRAMLAPIADKIGRTRRPGGSLRYPGGSHLPRAIRAPRPRPALPRIRGRNWFGSTGSLISDWSMATGRGKTRPATRCREPQAIRAFFSGSGVAGRRRAHRPGGRSATCRALPARLDSRPADSRTEVLIPARARTRTSSSRNSRPLVSAPQCRRDTARRADGDGGGLRGGTAHNPRRLSRRDPP